MSPSHTRGFTWGATVAMSWLWGLGFFFSIHFAQAYGWIGLVLFALPNALGLALFGAGVERLRAPDGLRTWIEKRMREMPFLFLAYQVIAIALTIFAITRYVAAETGMETPILWGLVLLCAAMLVSELLGFSGIIRLHSIYYILIVVLAIALLVSTGSPDTRPARGPYDLTFAGYVVPLIGGLLFGPWLDLQQWQRAVAMREAGYNVARGYGFGALMFLALLFLIGGLSIILVPEGVTPSLSAFDGHPHGEAMLTGALQATGLAVPLLIFAVIAGIAMLSTLDSANLALRWRATHLDRASTHPLIGMIPADLRTSTVPAFIVSAGIAWVALLLGAHLEHFMIFYATFFLVSAIVLVLTALRPAARKPAKIVVFLTGGASMSLMMIGYFEDLPLAMIAAVLLPFALIAPFATGTAASGADVPIDAQTAVAASSLIRNDAAAPSATVAEPSAGWFDDRWFTMPLMPTYTDTNSVGNVYFANYVGWIGKARELFFRACMPDFDIGQTGYFILTRSFNHKFVSEIREFQPVRVRLKIGGYNRKFVRLEHEIRRNDGSLVGKGEQSLMFVDAINYGPVDIPGEVYTAFIRYAS